VSLQQRRYDVSRFTGKQRTAGIVAIMVATVAGCQRLRVHREQTPSRPTRRAGAAAGDGIHRHRPPERLQPSAPTAWTVVSVSFALDSAARTSPRAERRDRSTRPGPIAERRRHHLRVSHARSDPRSRTQRMICRRGVSTRHRHDRS